MKFFKSFFKFFFLSFLISSFAIWFVYLLMLGLRMMIW